MNRLTDPTYFAEWASTFPERYPRWKLVPKDETKPLSVTNMKAVPANA